MKPIKTITELESLRDGDTIDTKGRFIWITGDLVFDEITHIHTRGGGIYTDGGYIRTNGGYIYTDGGFISTNGGNIHTRGGAIYTNGGHIRTQGGYIFTHGGSINTDGGHIRTRGGAIFTAGGSINGYTPPPIEDQITLLDEIRNRVLAHPESLDMSAWHCGSAHCLAGHAQVIKDGVETGLACDAGIKYIPLALPMFFEEDNNRVLSWLENREYAKGRD